jgi:HK97 gp10 family phage protein
MIFGLSSLNRKLNAIPKATRVEVRRVLDKSADEMVLLARNLVAVDDGNLRDTIDKQPGKHEMAVVVRAGGDATTVNGYDYALAVEHGTVDTPQQEFFWPAYRAIKKRAKSRATRAIKKAVRTAIGGG